MKFAFVDACNTSQLEDMASAFGAYSDDNAENQDQTYLGWEDEMLFNWDYDYYREVFWDQFGAGETASQAWWNAYWETWGISIYTNGKFYGYEDTTWFP